ncbi:MAG: hypothetical protein ACLTLQ_03165 [[Clostridium] scindens]
MLETVLVIGRESFFDLLSFKNKETGRIVGREPLPSPVAAAVLLQ